MNNCAVLASAAESPQWLQCYWIPQLYPKVQQLGTRVGSGGSQSRMACTPLAAETSSRCLCSGRISFRHTCGGRGQEQRE